MEQEMQKRPKSRNKEAEDVVKKKKVKEENMAKSVVKKEGRHKKSKKKNNVLVPVLCLIIGLLLGIIVSMLLFDFDKDDLKGKTQSANVESTVDQMLEEEGVAIETKYCDLYYPTKWESQIHVEQVESDVYTVQFYGVIEGKTEQHLFDIVFGGDNGTKIGVLNTESEEINVYMNFGENTFDETWTEDEKDVIYAMQEDVNYLLGMLEKENGFVAE